MVETDGRVYPVSSGKGATDLKSALEMAEKTGVLSVPQESLFLTVPGGIITEEAENG